MKKGLLILPVLLIASIAGFLVVSKDKKSNDSTDSLNATNKNSGSLNSSVNTAGVDSKSTTGDRKDFQAITGLMAQLANASSDEELVKIFLEALNANETVALRALKDLHCGEINCVALEQPFLDFYLNSDRPFDGLEAFKIIDENPDFAPKTFDKIMKGAGAKDLEKAYSWALENNNNSALAYGFDELGLLYAETENPGEKTKALMDTEMDTYNKASFLSGLIVGWIEKDPAASLEHFAELPKNDSLDWTLLHKMETITAVDPEAALQWAEYIQDSDFRESTIYEINKQREGGNSETDELQEVKNISEGLEQYDSADSE